MSSISTLSFDWKSTLASTGAFLCGLWKKLGSTYGIRALEEGSVSISLVNTGSIAPA